MKRFGSALGLFLLLSGCGSQLPVWPDLPRGEGHAVELRDTPFFPQDTYQCGPAALATVLVFAGKETDPAGLAEKVYLPGRRGSLQVELLGAVRREGLVPYPIEPTLDALIAELRAGRPVLVLQNLGLRAFPAWHYAVVIGYDPSRDEIMLRSGTRYRKVIPVNRFLRTWKGAEFWGFVALSPGELPAQLDRSRYLKAVSTLETIGQIDAALTAYRKAREQWPGDTTTLLGIGNSLYKLGDYSGAEKAFRRLIREDPRHAVAYNNLAQTLADQGRYDRALAVITKGLSDSALDPDLRNVLKETETDILRKR